MQAKEENDVKVGNGLDPDMAKKQSAKKSEKRE